MTYEFTFKPHQQGQSANQINHPTVSISFPVQKLVPLFCLSSRSFLRHGTFCCRQVFGLQVSTRTIKDRLVPNVPLNATISKNVTIGNNCVISQLSLLTKEFPIDNLLIGGIPAKIIKTEISWSV